MQHDILLEEQPEAEMFPVRCSLTNTNLQNHKQDPILDVRKDLFGKFYFKLNGQLS